MRIIIFTALLFLLFISASVAWPDVHGRVIGGNKRAVYGNVKVEQPLYKTNNFQVGGYVEKQGRFNTFKPTGGGIYARGRF